jgi:hypothetical protein
MSCVWHECKDWTWDGDPCYYNRKGSLKSMYWDNGMSSWNMVGKHCKDKQMRGYDHANYKGDYIVLRGHGNAPGGWDNRVSSVKEVTIPTKKKGYIVSENKDGCPGAGEQWEKSAGTRYRCFYSDSDNSQLRALYDHAVSKNNAGLLNMHTRVADEFCKKPENLPKRISTEMTCKKLDSTMNTTKEYCKLEEKGTWNLRTKQECSPENLGRFYEEVSSAFCDKHPDDEWCSCYNVKSGVCSKKPSAAGCAKMQEEHDAIIKSLPEDKIGEQARRALNNRKTCRALVCSGDKFIPQNLPGCELNISMCIQDVTIGGHAVDTGINIECNIDEKNQNEITKGKERIEKGFDPEMKPVSKDVTHVPLAVDTSGTGVKAGLGGLASVLSCIMCLLLIIAVRL